MLKRHDEEYIKKKQELASQPGTYVVRSNTLESRYFLVRLKEYDGCLNWIKSHIGVDIDTNEALNLIDRCRNLEEQFTEILNELRQFVINHKNKNKDEAKRTVLTG